MKRLTNLIALLITASFVLAACAPAATPTATPIPTKAPISVKDGLGRTVTLATTPKKIVSLAPSNTEILFAIGAGSQVIGRDDFSDYPAEAKIIASVGGSMGKYNLEEIARLQPDLVLAAEINTPEQIKALEDLKLTVFVVTNPTTLEALFTSFDTIGRITGRNTEAGKLNESLRVRVKNVEAAVAKTSSKPKVFYELDATDASKPWTAGAGSFIDILITAAGGENVAAKLKGSYAQISQEELIAANPEIILLGDAAYGVTADLVARRPGWAGIPAVKNNKILAFDDNLVSRPGPRLIDGLEIFLKALHPEGR